MHPLPGRLSYPAQVGDLSPLDASPRRDKPSRESLRPLKLHGGKELRRTEWRETNVTEQVAGRMDEFKGDIRGDLRGESRVESRGVKELKGDARGVRDVKGELRGELRGESRIEKNRETKINDVNADGVKEDNRVVGNCNEGALSKKKETLLSTPVRCPSSHLTDHRAAEERTEIITTSCNTAQCCTLPQLTTTSNRALDTPSLGCNRSMRTACIQRYLPRTAHRIVSPAPATLGVGVSPLTDAPATPAPPAPGYDSRVYAANHKSCRRSRKKCIYVSYCPDCDFAERRFVCDVVSQLKQNNMAADIWYDVDEAVVGEPCWLAARLEAAERCDAALLFLSPAYFDSSTCVYEARTLMTRLKSKSGDDKVTVFSVLYDLCSGVPEGYRRLTLVAKGCDPVLGAGGGRGPEEAETLIDLTSGEMRDRAHDELCNRVIASFSNGLEKYAQAHTMPSVYAPPTSANLFTSRPLRCWNVDDVQEWLLSLSIREFYCQSFEELKVDGNLLISLNDDDLIRHLSIDSRATRKKIMRQMVVVLERELKTSYCWHLRARSIRSKPSSIYMIYDPSDVRLAQSFKVDLLKRHINVLHHQKLGQSKEEFLQLNCMHLSVTTFVVVILTEASSQSPFVFHELLFADWLNKKLITAVFRNVWPKLRSSLKAVLGEATAVDFETTRREESLEVLENLVRPSKSFAGVVLEQAYLSQMSDSIRTLSSFANVDCSADEEGGSCVYISYHWDSQAKVHLIKELLQQASVSCWSNTTECPLATMNAPAPGSLVQNKESEHKHFKSSQVLLVALTLKHLQSDSCYRDLLYADNNKKPVIVVLIKSGTVWPPISAPPHTRRLITKRNLVIDMCTDKLFRQNKRLLIDKIKRLLIEK